MRKQKTLVAVLAFFLVATSFPLSVFAASIINQDVKLSHVIESKMETEAEAAAVHAQLTGIDSHAMLSEDKKEGRFSLKVTAGQTSTGYEQYTLVPSDYFDIADSSAIELWLKPGSGAEWIEFYTNGALITCDENGDGRFEVGKDLQNGIWSRISIDLLYTNPTINQGKNLSVRSNKNSFWLFDDISSKNKDVRNIDLASFVNNKTHIKDGRLEYKKTADETAYDIEPTVLTSGNRVIFQKTFDTNEDFRSGEVFGSVAANNGVLGFNYSNLCKGGVAISSGDWATIYPPSYAFDDSTSTVWRSSQTGNGTTGIAYIGYDFGKNITVYEATIVQGGSSYSVSSGILQYYDSISSMWIDIKTTTLAQNSTKQSIPLDSSVTASKFRLLANSRISSSNYWTVSELEFLGVEGSYTSPIMNISSTGNADFGQLTYLATHANWRFETAISTDGGETWEPWELLNNEGKINGINQNTVMQDARLQYRVSYSTTKDEVLQTIDTISVEVIRHTGGTIPLNGRIERIALFIDDRNLSGGIRNKNDFNEFPFSIGSAVALSGDGNTLFFTDTSNKNLYKLDIKTGNSEVIYNAREVKSVISNYDGTKACFLHTYVDSESNLCSALRLYSLTSSGSNTTLIKDLTSSYQFYTYDMTDEGDIAYISGNSTSTSLYYRVIGSSTVKSLDTTTISTGTKIKYLKDKIIASNRRVYDLSNSTVTVSNLEVSFSRISPMGDKVYFVSDSISYEYDMGTKVKKEIDVTATDIIKVLNDGRLVVRSANSLIIYNPITGEKQNILPSECAGIIPVNDISYNGKVFAYAFSDKIRAKTLVTSDSSFKYLLSFDAQKSWYSYAGGAWEKVYIGTTPTQKVLELKGMTTEEVISLTAKDFTPMYANGAEIYTVDIAILFSSINSFSTPSIGTISIVTDNTPKPTDLANSEACVYTAKSTAFTGSQWRRINRIYPIEINRNAAEFVYFIYSEGKYRYFDGTSWQAESGTEIADQIGDVKANWTQLKLKGMTAQQVRDIPAVALTAQLAYKDFSVVYCVKASDTTTEGYHSKITADYVSKLFAGSDLTLSITMIDGTSRMISGLNNMQIEDFMAWYTGRQNNKGTMVYLIKTGNENFFVNYHMIQSVTVTES